MNTITIDKFICLKPFELDNNIKNTILNNMRNYLVNKCSENNGYIISVNKIIKILDTRISNTTSDIICNVRVEVCSLKPVLENVYKATICMVFSQGIFVEIEEKMKVLIPTDKLEEFTFENFSFRNGDIVLSNDDIISIAIYDYKYLNNSFSCLGKFLKKID